VVFALIVVSLAAFVYCVLDVATTPASAVRTLPKLVWFVVLAPPLLGPALWFLFGRPARGARGRLSRLTRSAPERGAPDDDEEFLRDLRRRAEEQRRRARDPRDDAA
jgi:hypothetical protein